jgi:uncharacterized protein
MKQTVLITGASSGIGMELAKICAREGHNLVITARREENLKSLKSELEALYSVNVQLFVCDLTEQKSPDNLYRYTKENGIEIDLLINNAGVGDYGFFKETEWSRQQAIIDLNITALTRLTHLYLPRMLETGSGKIMNISSMAGFLPGPLMSVYYASKNYVTAFSEALANELKGTGISVTVLCPGPTESEFQRKANMQKSRLFDMFPVPGSAEVSEYGYRAMIKGKRVAIFGLHNRFLVSIMGLFPRNFLTAVARFIQERK